MNADGRNLMCLSKTLNNNGVPAWSPNGRKMTFVWTVQPDPP